MAAARISLDDAVAVTRTGDIWVFRGRTLPDRAIQLTTNSPVNHVGMALVVDDLPALMWHAELGRSLPDVWSGGHHRGAQLHDLRAAVRLWVDRYRQQVWLRQLDPAASARMEEAALRAVARLNGTPFPSHVQLAWRWLRGRAPRLRRGAQQALESAYCAEIVAMTYEAMGLLASARHSASWYDPGRFWSGDRLQLAGDHRLGDEIAVDVPDDPAGHRG